MNIYLVFVISIIYLYLMSQICVSKAMRCRIDRSESFNYSFLKSVSFIAFSIMALRAKSVGVDSGSYARAYQSVSQLKWNGLFIGDWDNHSFTMEKGYMITEKLLSMISQNSQWIFVFSSAIFILGIYLFIKKNCSNYLLCVFVFFSIGTYLLAMNLMRQSIAVGLCCIAWNYLQENKAKKFFIFYLLAITFHTSAIIFIITFLIKKLPANKKNFYSLFIGGFIFSIAGTPLIYAILKYFPIYEKRYGRGIWKIAEANGVWLVWGLVAVLILFMFFKDNSWNKNHKNFEIMIMCIIYLAFQVLGQSFDGLARIAMYFAPFQILLFDESVNKLNYNMKIFSIFLGSCFFALLFLRSASTEQYANYLFFWQYAEY